MRFLLFHKYIVTWLTIQDANFCSLSLSNSHSLLTCRKQESGKGLYHQIFYCTWVWQAHSRKEVFWHTYPPAAAVLLGWYHSSALDSWPASHSPLQSWSCDTHSPALAAASLPAWSASSAPSLVSRPPFLWGSSGKCGLGAHSTWTRMPVT